jgi:HK97 family phage prohead protease
MVVKESSPEPASIDLEKRQITFLASSPERDRDGDIIEPASFENSLKTYMTNPVILSQHQSRLSDGNSSVVGRAVKVWTDAKGLWVTVQFADTTLASTYWELYSQGYQRAVSVGFLLKKWRDDIDKKTGERIQVFTECELLEISLVAIPSNRAALSRSKANKLAFVQGKREDHEREKFLAEARQQDPEFDAKCEEFADTIMTYEFGLSEMPDKKEINYADLVRR